MKRIGLLVVAVSLSLSVAALAQQDQPKTERPSSKAKAEQPKAQRPSSKGKMVRGSEGLTTQIAQLKQEHQAMISELNEIKKLANEEKATKTLGAVDKLIARRNQDFQKRLEPLEKAQKKLGAQAKGGDKDKSDEQGNDKGKTEGGKSKSKDKNKGATASKE